MCTFILKTQSRFGYFLVKGTNKQHYNDKCPFLIKKMGTPKDSNT